MIEKINKMQEGLRKPRPKKESEGPVMVSYGPSSTTEEEIGRRVKTDILPKLAELVNTVEMCYNGHTYGEYDDDSASEREAMLKPLEKLYNALKNADKEMILFLGELSESIYSKEQ